MNIKGLIKNNIKFIIVMIIVIVLGVIGMTYALKVGFFNPIGINTVASDIDATIVFEDDSSGNITNTGNLFPIDDSLVTLGSSDTRILKVGFSVTGLDTNPENTIFDISLRDLNIDCKLRTGYLKWRLYKEENILSEGTFSPMFDVMTNDRMVLTETQEDLSTNTNNYTLLIWIGESCVGDINSCDNTLSQNNYLNESFSFSIKVELSVGSKKSLVRTTSDLDACDYTNISVPVCNTITYNGASQELVNEHTNYNLFNNSATNAGYYSVVAKLNDGYKWNDGTTTDKVLVCEILKKNVTITTNNQTITYGEKISSDSDNVNASGLISGNSIGSINLYSSIVNVGTGTIYASNAMIVDVNGVDVTNNYNIIYNDTGVITINSAS